ncbi:MAG: NifB/NifX family molybdenum-iron cluster-binding protein [Candidatus Hadarchaeia archaeon]
MVRLVVATQQGGLEDQVSPVFGRCQTYTTVDAENGEIKNAEVAQNQYANAMSGAGIQAAGFVANQGAEAVIAGNFGPNVASVLNQSGVKMVPASGMSVREAVQKYLDGEIEPVAQATSAAKAGMGGGGGRGMGMGRGMRTQQPSQQPTQGPTQQRQQPSGAQGQRPSQSTQGDRIDNLENRLEKLESQLKEITKGLEDLKNE